MLLATNYGNYGLWSPPLISEHGHRVDLLISVLHYFMLILFVAWGIFMIYCLTRFRQRPGHKATYEPVKGKISKYAEIAVAAFEAFLLLGLSMPVWASYKEDVPPGDDRVEIRVIGEQYQWNFHYPGPDGKFGPTDAKFIDATSNPVGLDEEHPDSQDDIWTIADFHIPVGRDIYIRLTSKDVIHSFFIPTMRVKQDAVPGMEIPIWFRVKEDATTENLKEEMTVTYPIGKVRWYKHRHHVATKDYADKSGQVILAAGAPIGATRQDGETLLENLRSAGVTELTLQPRNPLELICAQLCGNEHSSMKAQITTHTPEGFDAWVLEQSKEEDIDFGEDF